MAEDPNQHQPEFLPAVIRARYEKLTIYDVTAEELEILERGSSDSIYLNFGISLLSIAISFTVTLITTEIKNIKTYNFVVILIVVGYILGVFFMVLWYRNHRTKVNIIDTIRKRLPPAN